jgi:NADH-quinone oxidoreductase subunit I
MEQPPHPMRLGDDEGAYYRGDFSRAGGASPSPAPPTPAQEA